MKESPGISRRALLLLLAASGVASAFPVGATVQALLSVGLGSWITFNVGDDPMLRAECAAVIGAFFQAGGRMIDSSPMYGSSQEVIGWSLARLGHAGRAVLGRQGVDVGRRPGPDRGVASQMGRAAKPDPAMRRRIAAAVGAV